jgi:hypothetical protein
MSDFFGKLKGEFKKVGVKSSVLLETNKIKSEISALNKRKKDAFAALGEKIYNMDREEPMDFDLLEKEFETIHMLQSAIKTKEEEIKQLEEQVLENSSKYCSCGAVLDSDAIFCTSCGKKVEEEVKSAVDEIASTANEIQSQCTCGATLEQNVNFCTQCGKKVGNE